METPCSHAQPTDCLDNVFGGVDNRADQLFRQVTEENAYPAFRQLFRLYYTPLCRYAARFVHSGEVAEEIVADVFVRLWRNRTQIQLYASFLGYCFRAVKNQSLDYLKSRHQLHASCQELTDTHHVLAESGGSPEQYIIEQEFDVLLNKAVAQLPKQGQLIYRMSRDEGMKYREIAGQLGISIRTVETHMGRSCQTLKTQLQGYY